MSKEEIKPLRAEKPTAGIAEPLNDDVLKGVLADSFALGITEYYVMFDGIVGESPRSKKEVIVARIIVPPEALPAIQKGIENAIEFYKKEFKKDLRKKVKE